MCRAIAETHALDEVKDIRDQATALEAYAHQAKNFEAEDRCKEIRQRAERKWGQLYNTSEKAHRTGNQHTGSLPRAEGTKTLDEMGVTKDQSSKWQKLGAVPDDEFEAAVAKRRVEQLITKPDNPIEPVNADVQTPLLKFPKPSPQPKLERTRGEVAETATQHMPATRRRGNSTSRTCICA
jgi:hypothetical protein